MAAKTSTSMADNIETCDGIFDVPDDLSDWSDADFDPLVDENNSSVAVSNNDEEQYCVCGGNPTVSMVECEDADCTVKWWHFECAGLPTDVTDTTLPAGWLCTNCRPSTSGMSDQSSSHKELQEEGVDMPPKGKGQRSKGKKAAPAATQKENKKSSQSSGGQKQRKQAPMIKRPKAKYTKEDAMTEAPSYFFDSLQVMKDHPVFNLDTQLSIQVLTLVTHLLMCFHDTQFHEFCCASMLTIWDSVQCDTATKLKPEVYEAMWIGFRKATYTLRAPWQELLNYLNAFKPGEHNVIALNFLLQSVFSLFMTARNTKDAPTQETKEQEPMDKIEEKVLRYVAGYIPFSLLKKYEKQINPTAKMYCKFLTSWQVSSVKCAETFLEYTKEWIDAQSRGGLFKVSDKVYLFVRSMEFIGRAFLTKANLDNLQGVDLKEILFRKISNDFKVQTYWCGLIKDRISGDPSKKLMEIIIKYYIKTRTNAFIKVYLQIKKAEKNISRKAEKALRKELK